MITILHGDNSTASRNELQHIINSSAEKEIRRIDGASIDDTSLTQTLESLSLFGGNILVVIERLFGKIGRQPKKITRLCSILQASTADIVLWEDKELGKTTITSLGNPQIKLFKLPVFLFQFLDSLKPNNSAHLLLLLNKIDTPELLFALLVKRIRLLIQIADGFVPKEVIGWQKNRLTTQAQYFTMNGLVHSYVQLAEIEYSLRQGKTSFSLTELIEQWIVTLDYDH